AFWLAATSSGFAKANLEPAVDNSPKGPEVDSFKGAESVLQNAVRGTVRSSSGTLVGVTVTHVGGVAKTETDNQGNFTINVPNGATLRFSMVGFRPKDVVVNGTALTVTLEAIETDIEE